MKTELLTILSVPLRVTILPSNKNVLIWALYFSIGLGMNQVKGFVLSLVIVIITFVVSSIAAGLFADFIGVWKKPVIGSIAAFCVVISGYITAPSYKKIASAVWLIIGAIAAWVLSSTSPYPEDQPTLIPLYATYISGFIALLLCLVWHSKHNENCEQDKEQLT